MNASNHYILGYVQMKAVEEIRGRKLGRLHETLMIAKHETCIDFYGASERWI